MNEYSFFKMHGLGNDYIFIDGRTRKLPPAHKVAPAWCDRHRGIGGDGLVYILDSENASVSMKIFNADGSEAQTCGNALRCIGKYLDDLNELENDRFTIETMERIVAGNIIERNILESVVAIDMGVPVWAPAKIPVNGFQTEIVQANLALEDHTGFIVSCVSMGNPHCVIEVKDIDNFPVETFGPQIETHTIFPERINAGFMQVLDDSNIALRVWERGSGETMACGSGACAAYAVWSKIYCSVNPMRIHLPGGTLKLSFAENQTTIVKEGPAAFVYKGVIRF